MILTGAKAPTAPNLPKFIRLTIYSYLTVGTVLKTISYLSRDERASLKES